MVQNNKLLTATLPELPNLFKIIQKNTDNLFSLGATVGRASSRFLLVFLASLLLTKHEFGIFNILFSIYFFARLFSENSLNLPFIKFASDGQNDSSLVTFQIILLKVLYVVVVSVAILLAGDFIVKYSGLERKGLLYLLPVMLLSLTFYMFIGQILIYQMRMRMLFYYELLNALIFVLFLCIAYLSLSFFSTERFVLLFSFSMAIAAITGGIVFRRYISIIPQISKSLIGKIVNYSKFTVLSGISAVVILKADVLMLGYFRTPQEVGIYGVALFVNEAVNMVFDSVLRVCLPKASALSSELGGEGIGRLFRQSVKNIYIGIVPICIIIAVAAPYMIKIIYGGRYDDSIPLVYLFLLASLIKPAGYVAGVILGATGNIKIDNRNCWIAAVINIICNLMLIPNFGILGAAIASVISFTCLTFINMISFSGLSQQDSKSK